MHVLCNAEKVFDKEPMKFLGWIMRKERIPDILFEQ